jgi:hypothetical protein
MTAPTIGQLKAFFEAVDNDEVGDFNWQANKVAYTQLFAETTMGTFTVEEWFADAERRRYGWPQAIEADYEKYQAKLAESKQAQQEKSDLELALADVREQMVEIRAMLVASSQSAPAAEETTEETEPAAETDPDPEAEDEDEEPEAGEPAAEEA